MRIQLEEGRQRRILDEILDVSGLSINELAKKSGVCARSMRDWRREKFNANYEIIVSLANEFGIALPPHSVITDGWHLADAASLGGKARFKRYGAISTQEDRRRGGKISQLRRKEDPEKYRALGCKVRKDFHNPKFSIELAEAVGIILGDGGISDYQITVSLDLKVDYEYAIYVRDLFHRVFHEKPSWTERTNVIQLQLSGANLVEILEKIGLQRGNKITHQVGIPKWIFTHAEYQAACMRGLFDTDGGIYHHKKSSGTYIGWTFTSCSLPLIMGVQRILKGFSIRHSVTYGKNVYIYSLAEVVKCMKLVGSSNPKNIRKVQEHIKERWLSGRKHAFGVRAGGNPSRVRIPPSPHLQSK